MGYGICATILHGGLRSVALLVTAIVALIVVWEWSDAR